MREKRKTVWILLLAIFCLILLAAGCSETPPAEEIPSAASTTGTGDSSGSTAAVNNSTTPVDVTTTAPVETEEGETTETAGDETTSSDETGETTGVTETEETAVPTSVQATDSAVTTTQSGSGATTASQPVASGTTAGTTSPTVSKTTSGNSTTEQTTTKATPTTAPTVDKSHYVNSTGKVFQNFTFDYKAVSASYNVDGKYTVQDLGKMQLEEYPIDGVYDTAFNCIKVGDTYKMWWCRACPYDTIWYAESKDMKNWYNAQCVIDLNGYSTTWVKQMLSWPSVLYVNGKYHMFFEAPAKIADSGEYSNNIFYATSKDGISWTFYPNNKDPQPVIKDPVVKEGVYGVGQPKAFYKDGYFYVTYTDASTSGGNIRFTRSKGNGFSFEGSVYSHTMVLEGAAGAAIRYNEATDTYYLMVTATESQSGGENDTLFIMESKDPFEWPYKTRAQMLSKATRLSLAKDQRKKCNIDLVTNESGIVDSENMILVFMDGLMHKSGEDHRNTHTTWNGNVALVGTGSMYGKTLTLPNGKSATSSNLKWYQDKVASWKRPVITAPQATPVIDGTKDEAYGGGETALIETVTWSYENCKPTKTTGKANVVWDAEALYVYAEIKDATGPYTGFALEKPANLWRNDSLTLFIDVPDTKTGTNNSETLTPLSFMVIIDASGKVVFKDSNEDVCTGDFPGYQVSTKKISGGYVIEAKVPWYSYVKDQIKSGKTVGFDLQINDSFGDSVGRQAQVYWSDYTGDSFLYLDRWGQIKLQ